MEEPEKLECIVEARMKLKGRFEQQMQATPSVADDQPKRWRIVKTPRLFLEQNRPLNFRGMLLIGWFQAIKVIGRAYTELSLEIPAEVGG